MPKYLIAGLVIIFSAELVIVRIFLTSFEPSFSKTAFERDSFVAHTAKQKLVLPESLTLIAGSESLEVSYDELSTWIKKPQVILEPDESSLRNYFLMQTLGPSWTSSPKLDMIASLPLEERVIGQSLLEIAKKIDKPTLDAELVIENSRAKKFTPERHGIALDLPKTKKSINEALIAGRGVAVARVSTTAPKHMLEGLNDLGIRELLATGQSDFTGSTAARIQNIKVGASQYDGVIIVPEEEFSFNKYLGPIDAGHGYKPELVIKPEGATPEFGGGLCQVSTTAFRAAFFAGLPITERRNHSYAVRYYEWISDDRPKAVGLDATIYSGVQDMKFVNDTSAAILVWTRIEGKKLFFDFYGTKDGRAVVVDGPHPYDRRESGAVKSKVTRIVTKPGSEPIELTYDSKYVPPKTLPSVVEYPKPPESPPPMPEPVIQTQ